MADVGDLKPLGPALPTRPVKVGDDRRGSRQAPRKGPRRGDRDDRPDDGRPHIDEYAGPDPAGTLPWT